MVDLLPCPLCGSKPKGPERDGGSDERNGYNFVMRVTCKCGVSIGRPSHQNSQGWCDDTGHAEAEVIHAWNTRSQPHPKVHSNGE